MRSCLQLWKRWQKNLLKCWVDPAQEFVQNSGVEFEWDPDKSALNQTKHGISFGMAQALWNDSSLIILPSVYPDETRFLAIGKIEQHHWTAIFTERDERIRIISVRRSRTKEQSLYEKNHP